MDDKLIKSTVKKNKKKAAKGAKNIRSPFDAAVDRVEAAIKNLNNELTVFSDEFGMNSALRYNVNMQGILNLKLVGPPLRVEWMVYRLNRGDMGFDDGENASGWVFAKRILDTPRDFLNMRVDWKRVNKVDWKKDRES